MNHRFLTVALITLAASGRLPAQTQAPVRPTAPPIPREAAESERKALTQAAALVSGGSFEQAVPLLKSLAPAATPRVYVDWAPVPRPLRAGYRQAVQGALQAWNAALAPSVRFQIAEREDDADVLVLFERSVIQMNFGQPRLICSDSALDPDPAAAAPAQPLPANPAPARPQTAALAPTAQHLTPNTQHPITQLPNYPTAQHPRAAVIRIALNIPYVGTPHPATSLAHLVGQGLGTYLGLAPSENTTDLMGPDSHAPAVVVQPTAGEAQTVRQVQDARRKLLDYAQRRVAIYLPRARLAFEKEEVDAGEVWRGDTAPFVFKIKNAGDAPLEIDAKPTCGCTVAKYDKVILPGGEGTIQAELKTAGFRGKILKTIVVTSNDPEKPQMQLRLGATVKSVVQVLPTESPVIGLNETGATTYEMELQVSDQEPVSVSRVTSSAAYVTAKLDPASGPGASRYKVTLTIDPSASVGRSVFMVTAFTTSKREPQINIVAVGEKGVIAMPPSAYLGNVTAQTVLPVRQVVTLTRSSGSFHVVKVEGSDSNLEVKQETVQEGQQYRLMLTYKGGWPTGPIQRKLIAYTDSPTQPRIEIPVIGNILGTPLSVNQASR